MFRLACPCGRELSVRGSQAGCRVTCACGKEFPVPTLRELRRHDGLGEATPIVIPEPLAKETSNAQASQPLPSIRLVHGCGIVGPNGYISSFAMNHFVGLVQTIAWEAISSFETSSLAECMISVAIAPGGQKRVELDYSPKDTAFAQQDSLVQQIHEIDVPALNGGPVAFGVLLTMKHVTEQSLAFFPTLTEAMEAHGMEVAIRQALGCTPAAQKPPSSAGSSVKVLTNSWWRFLFRSKPKGPTAAQTPTAQEIEFAQQEFLVQCQAIAHELSWIDLERVALQAPNDSRITVAFAEKYCQQENWGLAIEWYDTILKHKGICAPLLGRRAALHFHNGNSQAALSDYSHAVKVAPEIESYRIERAQIYADLQAWDEAANDLDEAIRLAPNNPESFFQRGQVRLFQEKFSEAIDDFLEALRLDPNFGYAHFRLGCIYSYIQKDKAEQAIEHFSRALKLTDDNGEIRLHRCLNYFSQQKYALAMDDCDTVLAMAPNHAAAIGVRGRILQCEGQFEEAIIECSRAIELGHEHASVYLARAICYASTDQPTLAESDCDLALAIDPMNPGAIQLSGRLKLETGDIDEALEAFQRARDLAPDWTEPREYLALVHRIKENPQAAVDEQTLLIERQPKRASLYVNRAFALTQQHSYAAAAADYDRAIELEPENERLYFLRGTFRMNCQERDLALADFDRVLAVDGDDDNARACRANISLQLRRYPQAIDDFAHLIAKHPDHPQAYAGRAFAFSAIGNTEKSPQNSPAEYYEVTKLQTFAGWSAARNTMRH
jgi:tetratricopeptide (TPR) repeat protein